MSCCNIINDQPSYLLDIISGNIGVNQQTTQGLILDIIENNNYILTLESEIIDHLNNLEIIKYNDYDLTITNTVYANLPDSIPMNIITGNLHVSRIEDLDNYLTTIPIDGGSP